jgi:agmatine/peptidylarginine deiminase
VSDTATHVDVLACLLVSAEVTLRKHDGDEHEARAQSAVDALTAAIAALRREKNIGEMKALLAIAQGAVDAVYIATQRAVTGVENP